MLHQQPEQQLHDERQQVSLSSTSTSSSSLTTSSSQRRHRWSSKWGEHSPVVRAVVEGNSMTTCHDVQQMVLECTNSHSMDRICKTAAAYYEKCFKQKPGGQ